MNDKRRRIKRMNRLANDANKKIITNKYLFKKYEIYNKYNLLTKEIMTKCLTEKKIPPMQFFTEYYEKIKKDSDNLKNEYENVYSKFNTLRAECGDELSMGKPILEQKKNEEFTLKFLKKDRDDTIYALKTSIKSSKDYHLFREPKRDTLIDIKKGNKEMEKATNELQQSMLYECKKCNKFNNMIKKYGSKIIKMSKNIELLNNYIETNKFKVNNYKAFSRKTTKENNEPNNKNGLVGSERIKNQNYMNFGANTINEDEYENNSDDDKGRVTKINNSRKKNKVILEFIKVENLFDISNEEGENEKIIDDELHSDDEYNLENKVKQVKKLSTNYLKSIKNTIPSFNFNQIKFNRDKINEIDIYSVQRRQYKSKNIDNNIKEMKTKIEKINKKISLLKQKENIMREFVKKLEEKYEELKPMLYQKSENNIPSQSDYIINSLNKNENENKEKDNDFSNFLDGIPEVEEKSLFGNEENEDDDNNNDNDIVGNETEQTKKDDEVEKRLEEKLLKKVCKKRASHIKKTLTIKHNKNIKVLESLSGSIFKLKLKNNSERPRSK